MIRLPTRVRPDRIGWALATGCAAFAIAGALLAWAGGGGAAMLMAGAGAAALTGAGVLVLLGAPAWWLAGRLGRRGPFAAGVTGAVVAALLTVVMLAPGRAAAAPAVLWGSALATGAVAAFLGALIALAMWLVAYPTR